MDIYQPAEDSYLLQKCVQKYASGRVLDLGTGSGIQALAAAENISVREIIAVDINYDAIAKLKFALHSKIVSKIKYLVSDLFSNVSGKFDTIIFNPPYLPQDKNIEDAALYGGKKGYELSEKFFAQVSTHLAPKGKILFLFSSLTNKKKIDEIIETSLLESEQLEQQRFNFEDLFVYLITKTALLNELERKGIEQVHYFTHGKRGNIYTGMWNNNISDKKILTKKLVKVAIKAKRKESQAVERIKNEVEWLKIINRYHLGPRLLFYGAEYFVYEFVEGDFILDWINKNGKTKTKIAKMLADVLKQCFVLDQLQINKEELHRPLKHILVDNQDQPILLDFERCSQTDKPKNVTQLVEFLVRSKLIKREAVLSLLKEYKKNINPKNFEKIIKAFS
ncbi:MAG TPA: HemK2/MTQ2 family protein methyltransferase [Candidatus Nanoarchaeia archaeon]|nr:HemK2/MTQ2 family protein methyltransferase [Candidatus Nanoarchaeia archaeon]